MKAYIAIAQCKHCGHFLKPNSNPLQALLFPWEHANGYLSCFNPGALEMIHLAGYFASPLVRQSGLSLIHGGAQ